MERENYEERVMAIKDEILEEIREILKPGQLYCYEDPFYVHSINGEVATTEVCTAVEVEENNSVMFHVRPEDENETEMVCDEYVFEYDTTSFMDILFNLKKEIREEKLSYLRKVVKENECECVHLDGSFCATILSNGQEVFPCHVNMLHLDANDRIIVDYTFDSERYTSQESSLLSDVLVQLIGHVNKAVREPKIEQLREIVRRNGRYLITGDYKFDCFDGYKTIKDNLLRAVSMIDGKLVLHTTTNGESADVPDGCIQTEDLDRFINEFKHSEKLNHNFVIDIIRGIFNWMDADDANTIANALKEEVYEDVMEAAEITSWDSEDVKIAVRRVLFKKIGIEE